jgi:hypothetical protein
MSTLLSWFVLAAVLVALGASVAYCLLIWYVRIDLRIMQQVLDKLAERVKKLEK